MSNRKFFHRKARASVSRSEAEVLHDMSVREVKKIVKKEISKAPETKNHYSSAAEANVDFNGSGWTLFNPAQGVTSQTREGDRCVQTHLSIRGRCISSSTAGGYNAMRVIVFFWRADSGERVPNLDDVLQATYLATAQAPYAPLVVGQSAQDIQIISDRVYDLSPAADVAQSFHINKAINKKTYFNATATTGNNQIYMYVVSDDGATAYPRFSFVSNVSFKDL